MSQPYIDIILLCYGKFATTTKPCLDSLLADCNDPNFRLTIVDNGSYDNSANELREYLRHYAHVRTQFLDENIGFAGGMNYGVSLAEGEWLLLVSNDTIFTPGSLQSLYIALREQPTDVGLVGPITNAAGNGQEYPIRGTVNETLTAAKFVQQFPCNALIPAYRLDFFCVAIRKSLWDQLHGFDTIYGKGYYEDTDFSMRAKSVGSRILICEDAFVYHIGGGTFSTDPNTRKLIKRNKKIFLKRHPFAILHSKRQSNLEALKEYVRLHQENIWNEGLAIRANLRIKALLADMPRSPIKKWLWKRKVNKFLQKFTRNNVDSVPPN
jgi:GT2 family glycosyltransferase